MRCPRRNRKPILPQRLAATLGAMNPQEQKQVPEDAIADSNGRFAGAAARGEAGAMASLYTDDAALLPPDAEPVMGQAAIESFWRDGIVMGIRGVELETVRLEHGDVLAYEIGRYTLTFEPANGAAVTEVATCVLVHRHQQGGSWQRTVEIFNWNSPPVLKSERSRPR